MAFFLKKKKKHSKDSTAFEQSSSEDQGNCFIFGKGILSLLEIRVSVKAYTITRQLLINNTYFLAENYEIEL